MQSKDKLAIIIDIVFYTFIIFMIYLILKYVLVYVMPFIIAFSLVFLLQKPMIKLSDKLKINKNILTLISLFLLIIVIMSIIFLIGYQLYRLYLFFKNNNYFANFDSLINGFMKSLPAPLNKMFNGTNNSSDKIYSVIIEYLSNFVTKTVKFIPGIIVGSVVTVAAGCFIAFEYDEIIIFIKKQVKPSTVNFIRKIKEVINYSVNNLLKGYCLLFLITFCELLFGFFILNTGNEIPLALAIAMIDILPVLGVGTALVPWGVISIINGNISKGVGLITLYVVIAVARYFIEPRVIGSKVGLNPLISLAAIFIGLKLFGLIGIIALPLLCSVVSVLQKNGVISIWKT